jgi:hypothetical protein
MEITRMLRTDKGISLIILIVAIVATSIMGAGLASFMISKWRAYPFEARSYEALDLANAGIEFAIRYAFDNKEAFFQNPSSVIPQPPEKKSIQFGNGKFEISFDKDNNVLISRGIAGPAKREVRLWRFTGYIQGGISLVPGLGPYGGGGSGPGHGEDPKDVFIPLLNNLGFPIYIFKIHINLEDRSGHNADYIREISFRRDGSETKVYDYHPDTKCRQETSCPDCGDAPCKETRGDKGIEVPEPGSPYGDATLIFNTQPYYLFPQGISTEIITFKSAATKGTYNMKIFWSDNSFLTNPQMSLISFVID